MIFNDKIDVGSFLDNANNNSVLHGDSVINELSFIESGNHNNKSMLIEKGVIGGHQQ
jgi:hypothetical protein